LDDVAPPRLSRKKKGVKRKKQSWAVTASDTNNYYIDDNHDSYPCGEVCTYTAAEVLSNPSFPEIPVTRKHIHCPYILRRLQFERPLDGEPPCEPPEELKPLYNGPDDSMPLQDAWCHKNKYTGPERVLDWSKAVIESQRQQNREGLHIGAVQRNRVVIKHTWRGMQGHIRTAMTRSWLTCWRGLRPL
jgi:hypothetical protein